jgi:hypothetical protein
MRHVFTLMALVLLVPAAVDAQTSVRLTGIVSETVVLSILPNSIHSNVDTDVVGSGRTVRLTLWSTDAKSPVIRVPLLVRSNSGFRISAVFESETAELTQLSVLDVRATGTLVSPQAVSAIEVMDASQPLLVLSGPRISLGGTLDSPNNALQVTLLIRMKPQAGRGWLVHLTFTGTAAPLIR